MAKLLTFVLLLLSLNSFSRDTVLISDLDDTIKVTYSHRTMDALFRGIWSKKVFTSNSKLYNSIKKYTISTVVLSAGYTILRDHIIETLNERYIPYDHLILRGSRSGDKFMYKYNAIKNILTQNDVNLILIGDDIGADHKVYNEIDRNFPGRVLARYIRPVVGSTLPNGTIPYYSSYDIGAMEFQAGRMSYSDLNMIALEILAEDRNKSIIPKTFKCPINYKALGNSRRIYDLTVKVTRKIQAICKVRSLEFRQGPVQWDASDF
jgi:hypothetical protein